MQGTAAYSLPAPDMHAAAAREAATPFVRLQEPVPLTPVINEAHEQHTKVSACHLSLAALPSPLLVRKSMRIRYMEGSLLEPVPLTPKHKWGG